MKIIVYEADNKKYLTKIVILDKCFKGCKIMSKIYKDNIQIPNGKSNIFISHYAKSAYAITLMRDKPMEISTLITIEFNGATIKPKEYDNLLAVLRRDYLSATEYPEQACQMNLFTEKVVF